MLANTQGRTVEEKNVLFRAAGAVGGHAKNLTLSYFKEYFPSAHGLLDSAKGVGGVLTEVKKFTKETTSTVLSKTREIFRIQTFRNIFDWFTDTSSEYDNKDTENLSAADMGLDFDTGDLPADASDGEKTEKKLDETTKTTLDKMEQSSDKVASAVVETSKKMAEVNVASLATMTNILEKTNSILTSGFDSVNSNLKELIKVVTENTGSIVKVLTASKEAENKSSGSGSDKNGDEPFTVGNLLKGKLNLKSYLEFAKNNLMNLPELRQYNQAMTVLNMVNSTSGMGGGIKFEHVLKLGIDHILNEKFPTLTSQLKGYDRQLTKSIGKFLLNLGNGIFGDEKIDKDNKIMSYIAKIFGVKLDFNSRVSTLGTRDTLQKNQIPFDSETKESIVNIIPGYLKDITEAITGIRKEYDTAKRTFRTEDEIINSFREGKLNVYDKYNFASLIRTLNNRDQDAYNNIDINDPNVNFFMNQFIHKILSEGKNIANIGNYIEELQKKIGDEDKFLSEFTGLNSDKNFADKNGYNKFKELFNTSDVKDKINTILGALSKSGNVEQVRGVFSQFGSDFSKDYEQYINNQKEYYKDQSSIYNMLLKDDLKGFGNLSAFYAGRLELEKQKIFESQSKALQAEIEQASKEIDALEKSGNAKLNTDKDSAFDSIKSVFNIGSNNKSIEDQIKDLTEKRNKKIEEKNDLIQKITSNIKMPLPTDAKGDVSKDKLGLINVTDEAIVNYMQQKITAANASEATGVENTANKPNNVFENIRQNVEDIANILKRKYNFIPSNSNNNESSYDYLDYIISNKAIKESTQNQLSTTPASASGTPSASASGTPSASVTPSASASGTPSASVTPSPSASASGTPSASASGTTPASVTGSIPVVSADNALFTDLENIDIHNDIPEIEKDISVDDIRKAIIQKAINNGDFSKKAQAKAINEYKQNSYDIEAVQAALIQKGVPANKAKNDAKILVNAWMKEDIAEINKFFTSGRAEGERLKKENKEKIKQEKAKIKFDKWNAVQQKKASGEQLTLGDLWTDVFNKPKIDSIVAKEEKLISNEIAKDDKGKDDKEEATLTERIITGTIGAMGGSMLAGPFGLLVGSIIGSSVPVAKFGRKVKSFLFGDIFDKKKDPKNPKMGFIEKQLFEFFVPFKVEFKKTTNYLINQINRSVIGELKALWAGIHNVIVNGLKDTFIPKMWNAIKKSPLGKIVTSVFSAPMAVFKWVFARLMDLVKGGLPRLIGGITRSAIGAVGAVLRTGSRVVGTVGGVLGGKNFSDPYNQQVKENTDRYNKDAAKAGYGYGEAIFEGMTGNLGYSAEMVKNLDKFSWVPGFQSGMDREMIEAEKKKYYNFRNKLFGIEIDEKDSDADKSRKALQQAQLDQTQAILQGLGKDNEEGNIVKAIKMSEKTKEENEKAEISIDNISDDIANLRDIKDPALRAQKMSKIKSLLGNLPPKYKDTAATLIKSANESLPPIEIQGTNSIEEANEKKNKIGQFFTGLFAWFKEKKDAAVNGFCEIFQNILSSISGIGIAGFTLPDLGKFFQAIKGIGAFILRLGIIIPPTLLALGAINKWLFGGKMFTKFWNWLTETITYFKEFAKIVVEWGTNFVNWWNENKIGDFFIWDKFAARWVKLITEEIPKGWAKIQKPLSQFWNDYIWTPIQTSAKWVYDTIILPAWTKAGDFLYSLVEWIPGFPKRRDALKQRSEEANKAMIDWYSSHTVQGENILRLKNDYLQNQELLETATKNREIKQKESNEFNAKNDKRIKQLENEVREDKKFIKKYNNIIEKYDSFTKTGNKLTNTKQREYDYAKQQLELVQQELKNNEKELKQLKGKQNQLNNDLKRAQNEESEQRTITQSAKTKHEMYRKIASKDKEWVEGEKDVNYIADTYHNDYYERELLDYLKNKNIDIYNHYLKYQGQYNHLKTEERNKYQGFNDYLKQITKDNPNEKKKTDKYFELIQSEKFKLHKETGLYKKDNSQKSKFYILDHLDENIDSLGGVDLPINMPRSEGSRNISKEANKAAIAKTLNKPVKADSKNAKVQQKANELSKGYKATKVVKTKGGLASPIGKTIPADLITSPFGYRYHPTTGRWTGHQGVDIGVGDHTPLYAADDGFVTSVMYQYDPVKNVGYGNLISFKNPITGVNYLYAHMDSLPNFKVGAKLKKGQQIGFSGHSGGVTGPHLHFEVRPGSPGTVDDFDYIKAVDPMPYLNNLDKAVTYKEGMIGKGMIGKTYGGNADTTQKSKGLFSFLEDSPLTKILGLFGLGDVFSGFGSFFEGIFNFFGGGKSKESSAIDVAPASLPIGSKDSVRDRIYKTLRNKGFSKEAAIGILANIQAESSFNPKAISKDGYGSVGICQWTDSRKTNLINFAKKQGKNPNDIGLQVDFMLSELAQYPHLMALKGTDDSGLMAEKFCRLFERPADPDLRASERRNMAKQLEPSMKKLEVGTGGVDLEPSNGSIFVNMFRADPSRLAKMKPTRADLLRYRFDEDEIQDFFTKNIHYFDNWSIDDFKRAGFNPAQVEIMRYGRMRGPAKSKRKYGPAKPSTMIKQNQMDILKESVIKKDDQLQIEDIPLKPEVSNIIKSNQPSSMNDKLDTIIMLLTQLVTINREGNNINNSFSEILGAANNVNKEQVDRIKKSLQRTNPRLAYYNKYSSNPSTVQNMIYGA